jgi:TRAP-type C4-dicarboxylate transport system permease large subunit
MVAVAGVLLLLSAVASRAQASSLARASPIVGLILITIGGIYGGIFTPVVAAAVGAVLALLVALVRRAMTRAAWSDVLLQTMKTTGMAFLILIGAHVFQPFLALTHLPGDLATALTALDIGPLGVLLLVMLVFILLGTFLEGFAMLVLMVPIVLPLIEKSGVGAYLGIADVEQLRIWFGVLMVIVLEMGLISPPVGVNVFVVKGIAEHVPMADIFRGIGPFWLAMVVCLALLIAFPGIALYLPNTMIR